MSEMLKRAWITWETQRRSIELSRALNCDLYLFEYTGILRYPKCVLKTISVLSKNKYNVVFVQNPSMILAAVVCFCKILFRKVIIVDRHSTFKINTEAKWRISYLVYKILNSFTLKYADLTIVTNQYLNNLVEISGGRAFVLPDKIPAFPLLTPRKLLGKYNVLFVCSYAKDEPVIEVIAAMFKLKETGIFLYVTGNFKKIDEAVINSAPSNVIFTGYLSDSDYAEMLQSVDAVMVLTTSDHTMMCGCYEAVSVGKPLVTSNKELLLEYFHGSVFVENNKDDIARGILDVMNQYNMYFNNSRLLKCAIEESWLLLFDDLLQEISHLNF